MKITLKQCSFTLMMMTALMGFSNSAIQPVGSEISGKLLNQNGEPLMYAAVALLSVDSTIVNSAISTTSGDFAIREVLPGNYLLQVSHLECEKYTTAVFAVLENQNKTVPTITVAPSVTALNTVEITAKKALIEVKADKIIFNVESSPSAAGTNGLDLLKKSPGVTVDIDNNISLLGKGDVQIYLNGVPSNLSGNDLASFLQSLTSDVIESIEIISNPSAKYDAEGTGGVINIVMKKNLATGFNGSLASSFTKGIEYRYSNSLSLNYGSEKVKTNFDFTQSFNNYLNFFDDYTLQLNSLLELHSKENSIKNGYNVGINSQVQISKKHLLIVGARAIFTKRDNSLASTTDISQINPLEFSEVLSSQADLDGTSSNYVININDLWSLNKTSSLSSNVSLGRYNYESSTLQPNTYFEQDGETINRLENNSFDSNTHINLASAKVDYDKSWEKVSFSAGLKFSHILTENSFAFFNIEGTRSTLDSTKSNDFNYTENVAAAFANVNYKFNPFFTVNAGVRAENTDSHGQLIADIDINNKDVKRSYLNFFPNVSLSFDKQEDHAWNLSLGRRITRPNYQDLNPFETPTSQLVIWKGNPFLNPSYSMNYQLSYSYKQKYVITAAYTETSDFFAKLIETTGELSSQIIPRNLDNVENLAISVACPITVAKFWEMVFFGTGSRRVYKGNPEGTEIDLKLNQWNYRFQNNFYLPGDLLIDITFSQESDFVWRGSVNMEGTYQLDFGVRKDFFDKRLQIRITGQDIFNTANQYFYNSNYGGIALDGVYRYDSRRFGAGATFKFGNQKAKTRVRKSSGLDDELNRIGN